MRSIRRILGRIRSHKDASVPCEEKTSPKMHDLEVSSAEHQSSSAEHQTSEHEPLDCDIAILLKQLLSKEKLPDELRTFITLYIRTRDLGDLNDAVELEPSLSNATERRSSQTPRDEALPETGLSEQEVGCSPETVDETDIPCSLSPDKPAQPLQCINRYETAVIPTSVQHSIKGEICTDSVSNVTAGAIPRIHRLESCRLTQPRLQARIHSWLSGHNKTSLDSLYLDSGSRFPSTKRSSFQGKFQSHIDHTDELELFHQSIARLERVSQVCPKLCLFEKGIIKTSSVVTCSSSPLAHSTFSTTSQSSHTSLSSRPANRFYKREVTNGNGSIVNKRMSHSRNNDEGRICSYIDPISCEASFIPFVDMDSVASTTVSRRHSTFRSHKDKTGYTSGVPSSSIPSANRCNESHSMTGPYPLFASRRCQSVSIRK